MGGFGIVPVEATATTTAVARARPEEEVMSYQPAFRALRAALTWTALCVSVVACAEPPDSLPPPAPAPVVGSACPAAPGGDPPLVVAPAPAAGAGANPIAIENALLGADDWQLTRPADARQIEGFVDQTSVAAGGSVKLYVNVAGGKPYDLHVYRMGFYGGKGARLVAAQANQIGVAQPAPIVRGQPTVVEASNWCWRTFDTQPTWTSGMYLLRLSRKDGGAVTHQSYIPLVVRDDSRTADYVLQFAVTTYQAYNSWPRYPTSNPDAALGRSTYQHSSGGPAAVKVSFQRPYGRGASDATLSGVGAGQFLTHDYDFNNSAAGWEYAMVRWLEGQGYDLEYQTNLDTHATGVPAGSKALLSVGHDEYWSVPMRQHVDAAKAAGVDVAFFGANNAYWNIRFEDGGQTLVAYKDEIGSDPRVGTFDESWLFTATTNRATSVGQPAASGASYSTSDFAHPDNLFEEKLIGASWYGGDINSETMALGAGDVCHWAFTGSGVTFGDRLPGLLGYEISANNFGLPSGVQILARTPHVPGGVGARPETAATCPRKDGAPSLCSDVTLYQQGAAVGFSTGTIQWSWGLDDLHAGAGGAPRLRVSRADPRIAAVTKNVLDRATANANPTPRGGADGYAPALDGASSYVEVPHRADQNSFPLTASAWVRANGDGGIVNKYVSASANGFQLYVWDGRLRAWYFGASGSVYGGGLGLDGGPIADGRWHHVALAIDPAGGRLYVDGRLVATQGWTGAPSAPTTTVPLSFGRYPGPARQFLRGTIDEVALWSVALTSTQIASLAAGASPSAVAAGPWIGHWRFDEPTTALIAADSVGTANGQYQGARCAIASSRAALPTQSFHLPQWSDVNGWGFAPHYRTIAYPDIDGDDRPDLCARASAGLECWTSGGARLSTTLFRDVEGWAQPKYYETIRFGDVNADGKDDVCARGSAGVQCHLSAGATPLAIAVTGPPLSDAQGWGEAKYYSTFQLADVTGDGAADLCYRGYWGLYCSVTSVANGTATFSAGQPVATLGDPDGWGEPRYYSTIRFVDLDDDGKADVCYRGAYGLFCRQSQSSGGLVAMAPETMVAPLTDAAGWGLPEYYGTIRYADLDADGHRDVCYRSSLGVECRRLTDGATIAGPPLTDAAGWRNPALYQTIGLADVTGDGRADLCARWPVGLACWRSRGASFEGAPTIALAPWTDAAGYAVANVYETVRLVDLDGDDRAEACVRGTGGLTCQRLALGE